MGIWSNPVVTICYDKNNELIDTKTVKLDFTHIEIGETLSNLENHDIIVRDITNFDDSVMNACEISKIYGYWNESEQNGWNKYFKIVFEQNDNVYEAQAHFFCQDLDFPYYISCKRNNLISLYVGNKHSVLYTIKEKCELSFDKYNYIKCIVEDNDLFLKEFSKI
jgi:hypothetical protein